MLETRSDEVLPSKGDFMGFSALHEVFGLVFSLGVRLILFFVFVLW